MRIEEIDQLEEMEALRSQWTELVGDSQKPTVFSTWEWQYAAARHLAPSQGLRLLLIFDSDRLIGILPLMTARILLAGTLRVEALRCLGGSITDYNALVVRRRHLKPVIRALVQHLSAAKSTLEFENILPGSPLSILARALVRAGFRNKVYDTKTALVAGLEGNHEQFMQGLTRKFRKTLRNNQNYMDRVGGYSCQKEADSPELLESLVRLHTDRWQTKGEHGALAAQRVREFHSFLRAIQNKSLSTYYYTIRRHGSLAAILYGFAYRDRFYAYLSGFDRQHERISPGNMMLHYTIGQLYTEGTRLLDMLRGSMKYKQSWATAERRINDAYFFPPTPRGFGQYINTSLICRLKDAVPPSLKRLWWNAMKSGADR